MSVARGLSRQFPAEYSTYIQDVVAGLSRQFIEEKLEQDGYKDAEIEEFWIAVAYQAITDACNQAHLPPTIIWGSLRHFQTIERFSMPTPSQLAPCAPNHRRIVCISDTHGLHDQIDVPDGDILIHAGDFTDTGDRAEVLAFDRFLGTLPHRYKLLIAGNHESTFDVEYYANNWTRYGHKKKYDPKEVRALIANGVYLEDQLINIDGLRVYGTPWQPEFCNWAFNLKRGEELRKKWELIPDNIDILVSHTPPLGRGDTVNGDRVGDVDLLRQIQQRVQPLYHVFGHVHEGYGSSSDGCTVYVNASCCTEEYAPTNPAIVFDIPIASDRPDPIDANGQAVQALDYDTQLKIARSKKKIVYPENLRHLRIDGSEAGEKFDAFLEERPIVGSARAMKYLFKSEKYRLDSSALDGKAEDDRPDYSVPIKRFHRTKLQLTRRLSLSVIDHLDDDYHQELSHAKFSRRRELIRREGVASIPIEEVGEDEEDEDKVENVIHAVEEAECVLCKFQVSGHICDKSIEEEYKAEEVRVDEIELQECVLCKYQVDGHKCDTPAAIQESDSTRRASEIKVVEEETKKTRSSAKNKPARELQQHSSSWF